MKVKCLVQDEFVSKGKIYDVIAISDEDEPCCAEVMSDGLNGHIPVRVYLRLYADNPEYEVVNESA